MIIKTYHYKCKYRTKLSFQAKYKTHCQVHKKFEWWYRNSRLSSNLKQEMEIELDKDWLKMDLGKMNVENVPG